MKWQRDVPQQPPVYCQVLCLRFFALINPYPVLCLKNGSWNDLFLFRVHAVYVIDDVYAFKQPEFTSLILRDFLFAFCPYHALPTLFA
jgi:hypothetical protein